MNNKIDKINHQIDCLKEAKDLYLESIKIGILEDEARNLYIMKIVDFVDLVTSSISLTVTELKTVKDNVNE